MKRTALEELRDYYSEYTQHPEAQVNLASLLKNIDSLMPKDRKTHENSYRDGYEAHRIGGGAGVINHMKRQFPTHPTNK